MSSTLPGSETRHKMITPLRTDVISVRFADREGVRTRKVVTRSRARSTGKYPSWKVGRMIQWESTHELNAYRLLDSDPAVLRFAEQPCVVVYRDAGIERRHYPDILVEYADRKELWEVKLAAEASGPEVLNRTAIMRQLAHWGYTYAVVTAEQLQIQPRLGNAMRLCSLGGFRRVLDEERESVRLHITDHGILTWGQVCSGLFGPNSRQIICRLCLEGALYINLDLPWTTATPVIAGSVV